MKLNHHKALVSVFALIILVGIGSKVGMQLTKAWTDTSIEQARIEAEARERERKLAEEKVKAERDAKLTKAAVTKVAEEYAAQKTAMGAYKRPGDGYKFTLAEKDAYGKPILLLYDRGAVVDSFKVRSAGPDETYYTDDDIVEDRWTANGAGAVDGVRSSAGDLLQGAKAKIFGSKKQGKP